jgi:hypothetical protein
MLPALSSPPSHTQTSHRHSPMLAASLSILHTPSSPPSLFTHHNQATLRSLASSKLLRLLQWATPLNRRPLATRLHPESSLQPQASSRCSQSSPASPFNQALRRPSTSSPPVNLGLPRGRLKVTTLPTSSAWHLQLWIRGLPPRSALLWLSQSTPCAFSRRHILSLPLSVPAVHHRSIHQVGQAASHMLAPIPTPPMAACNMTRQMCTTPTCSPTCHPRVQQAGSQCLNTATNRSSSSSP